MEERLLQRIPYRCSNCLSPCGPSDLHRRNIAAKTLWRGYIEVVMAIDTRIVFFWCRVIRWIFHRHRPCSRIQEETEYNWSGPRGGRKDNDNLLCSVLSCKFKYLLEELVANIPRTQNGSVFGINQFVVQCVKLDPVFKRTALSQIESWDIHVKIPFASNWTTVRTNSQVPVVMKMNEHRGTKLGSENGRLLFYQGV